MSSIPLTILLIGVAAVIGPVLGLVVDRAVEREDPRGGQRCVHCRARQGARSLLPIANWVQRCPSCGRTKGVRYVAVDVVLVAAFVAIGQRFGSSWQLVPYLGLVAALVVLSAIDLETHLLPNIVVWPSIWLALFVILTLSGERGDSAGLYAALIGGGLFGGFIGMAHLLNERGMGRGDVKLALLLGLFVGWLQPDRLMAVRLVFYSIILALLGGGLVGLAFNRLRGRGRAEIPFGPALASATLVIIIASPRLVETL